MAETMSDRVRDVGDGLIMAFPITNVNVAGQTDLKTVRLYYFQVSRQTRYYQEYTSLSNITSGSQSPSSGFDYLGDTGVGSGDDIFRMENDDWHLMHFGVGTNHPDLHVFHAVSPKSNGNPAQERNGQDEDIVPGTDDRGWYSSVHIPDKYDPPAFTERVSFRNSDSGEWLQWAFDNDGASTLSGGNLTLFFSGRGYKVHPVTNRQKQDLMLQMALRRPDDPQIDTILHSVGGVNNMDLGTGEPDAWANVDLMKRDFNAEEFQIVPPPGGGGGGGGGPPAQTPQAPRQ